MAYLDLSSERLLPAPAPTRASPTILPAPRPVLGSDEHHVLFLSRRDGVGSLATPSALGARLRCLFGLARPNPLADPRLEALRRFAVLLRRHGARLQAREELGLAAAGYDADKIAEVRRVIGRELGRRRTAPGRRRLLAGLAVAVVTAQLLLHRFLTAYLDDGVAGLIGTMGATALAVPPFRLVDSVLSRQRTVPASSR